jgi:glucose-6-phosphate-specific signal transduction histidine kinase
MCKKDKLPIISIAAVMLFGISCGGNPHPAVSDISGAWLEIKTELGSKDRSNSLETKIDNFLFTLDEFLASPIGSLYQTARPGEMSSIKAITPVVINLKTSIQNENMEGILAALQEIDRAVNTLQQVDTGLSETSQMHYFLLFFFFSLLVISSILVLRALQGRLEKVEIKEQQSLVFSRETVMAQEQERSRIARELHDTVSQDLWRLSFQADSIDKAADSGERSRLCAEVAKGQREIMGRIRILCDTLIPSDFERRGLGDALRSLCYNFWKRTGIECQVSVQKDLELEKRLYALDSDTQLQCFRIVQECHANIEKHSGANEVSVLVCANNSGRASELLICVSDNGRASLLRTGKSVINFGWRGIWACGTCMNAPLF